MGSQTIPASQPEVSAAPSRIPGKRRFRLGWKSVSALCVLAFAVVGGGAGAVWLQQLPSLDDMNPPATSYLKDSAGGALVLSNGTKAAHVPIDTIPGSLTEAVLALEDSRFRSHGGLDIRAITRAFARNLAAGGIVEGGSTITQQLVKISYLSPEKTYSRKLHEAMLARELEARFTKDEILERYLNSVYLGSGAYGIGAAAQVYFGKDVADLTPAESAILAATIQLPSTVNPFGDTDALRDRAERALDGMERAGQLDRQAANAARVAVATMEFRPPRPAYGGWFAHWVQDDVARLANSLTGPVELRTTLDPDLQIRAERVIAEVLGDHPMEAALVALRPDGTVAAMVGGRDYGDSQFNRATDALRQPGSTFKTFVYLAALAEGISPDRTIADRPVDIDGYRPENFGGRFHGTVTLRQALAKSINVATVTLAMHIGIDKVAKAARALGIDADLSETPSLALGASGVTLLDLTEAYAALATGRAPVEARGLAGLTGPDGNVAPFDRSVPAADPEADKYLVHGDEIAGMLREVVTNGTGRAVADIPAAVGKTGTSQDFRDALFVGWNDRLIVGVWVGNDDNSPMDGITGGSLPAEIWAKFLDETPTRDELPALQPEAVASAADVPAPALVTASASEVTLRRLTERLGGTSPATGAQNCNVRACERFYRSFRASDCTFQPYGNRPRELCTR